MSESNGGAESIPAFDAQRVLLVVNPGASHAQLATSVGSELQDSDLGLPIEVVPTIRGGIRANQEYFAERIEEGDCIVVVAGDGGVREALSALLLPEFRDKLGNIVATTVGGGDRCDMRWSLHGLSDARPSDVIKNGLVRPTSAITWHSLFEEEAKGSVAFSYNGHGKTAIGAGVANEEDYHDATRLLREADLVYEVLTNSNFFKCEWLGGIKAPGPEELSDLSIFAGPRMAGQFHLGSRHYDEKQRLHVVRTGRGPLRTVANMGLLALGVPIGTLTDQELKFKVIGPIKVHFDGEGPLDVPSGSEITVGRHPAQIKLLYSPHMLPPRMRPPQ